MTQLVKYITVVTDPALLGNIPTNFYDQCALFSRVSEVHRIDFSLRGQDI